MLPRDEKHAIKCEFCGREVANIETAVNLGWVPTYYDGDDECDGPICELCVENKLEIGPDGELQIKGSHTKSKGNRGEHLDR